jgi:hypothetical protein
VQFALNIGLLWLKELSGILRACWQSGENVLVNTHDLTLKSFFFSHSTKIEKRDKEMWWDSNQHEEFNVS